MRRIVALLACLGILVGGTSSAWAQTTLVASDVQQSTTIAQLQAAEVQLITLDPTAVTNQTSSLGFDITAPTIIHTPPIHNGVAGELQTVVAEISDNQAVERASLIYRNSSADYFSTIEMSADATNITWLAAVETTTDDTALQYYIVAEDTDGNRVQKGSEGNPLTMQLQRPELFGAIAPLQKDNKPAWIGIGLGVFVVAALLGATSASGNSGSDEAPIFNDPTTCCTITFIVPNVSTD